MSIEDKAAVPGQELARLQKGVAVDDLRRSHMKRSGVSLGSDNAAPARIIWRDGPFLVECTGRGAAMELCVDYERFVMAREAVATAAAGWIRGSEICRQLSAGDMDRYERGSA